MPSSWVNTECSIHWVQLTPRIVCCPFIVMISSWPQNVALAFGVPPYKSIATSQFCIRASNVKSPCHIPTIASQLTDELSPGAPSINCLQVLAQYRSITASKCISKLPWLRLPQLYLQTPLITASKCISNLARSWPPSVSPDSLHCGLQVRTIMAPKCISKLTRLRPPQVYLQLGRSGSRSASLSSLDHGFHVYLQIR